MLALLTSPSRLVLQGRWRWWGSACVLVALAGCAAQPGAMDVQTGASHRSAPNPQLAQVRLQLATLHWQEGRTGIALQELASALQADPHSVDAWNLQGWVQLQSQQWALARSSFTQALALRPNDAHTLYNLGWLACQEKRYAVADEFFDQALAGQQLHGQSLARTWMAKAVCLRDAGDVPQALLAMEKAAQIDEGSPVVAYNFADILYAHGDTERAARFIRRIHEGQFVTPASLWLAIKVERRLGNADMVRQLADQLHKRFPESQEWQRFERGTFDD